MIRHILTIIVTIVILGLIGAVVFRDNLVRFAFSPRTQPMSENITPVSIVTNATDTPESVVHEATIEPITVVADNLEIPWDIGFLPHAGPDNLEGGIVVTERSGNLVRITPAGQHFVTPVDAVKHSGEGGLLGLALHPDFEENHWIYLYITGHLNTETESGTENRVVRYTYNYNIPAGVETMILNDTLTEETIILDGIPGALFHNGGQIEFGPDWQLYILTGDARDPDLSQDLNSLAGKVLRVTDTGEPVSSTTVSHFVYDNPFIHLGGNAAYVWSYGHRNPQGIAWSGTATFDRESFAPQDPPINDYLTEHGRSGLLSGLDELNGGLRGKNFGWPDSQGDDVLPNTVGPLAHSGPDITWAPASLAIINGEGSEPTYAYFGGLRGESLYRTELTLEGASVVESLFFGEYGRIRAAVTGPDGMLYISTSNRDGRGEIREGDDKIIRIDPMQL